jgi:Rho-binding antiterminator
MISCHQYDYIEIACMYHYPVALTLKSGSIIKGIAIDTVRNEARQECIKIQTHEGEVLIVLDDIAKVAAYLKTLHNIPTDQVSLLTFKCNNIIITKRS